MKDTEKKLIGIVTISEASLLALTLFAFLTIVFLPYLIVVILFAKICLSLLANSLLFVYILFANLDKRIKAVISTGIVLGIITISPCMIVAAIMMNKAVGETNPSIDGKFKLLFENKECEKCGTSYDIVEPVCPKCKTRNKDVKKYKINQTISWLPFWKQIGFFAIGFLGLNIFSIFVTIFLPLVVDPESITYVMLNNTICYFTVFIAMLLFLISGYRQTFKSFKKWLPYIVGIAGGIFLIIFSISYNLITHIFIESGTNANQSAANDLMKTYPLISLILIGIIGPIVEEFTYRLGLFSFLRRINVWVAYLVTIAFFTFIHFSFDASNLLQEFISLPIYIMAGFVLCLLYDKLGFAASITAHITNNFIAAVFTILATLLTK